MRDYIQDDSDELWGIGFDLVKDLDNQKKKG